MHVAFVIDAYARRIVGWRRDHYDLTAGARRHRARELGPAPRRNQRPDRADPSQRSRQSVHVIAFTDRLIEAGIDSSVGATGDSYDNALAETINGLCKTDTFTTELSTPPISQTSRSPDTPGRFTRTTVDQRHGYRSL